MPAREKPSCYEKAVELLARRSHFEAELSRKLGERGYGEEEISQALARLRQQGYLDDGRTAGELVEQRRARGPEGSRRLQAELARRGVDAGTIGAAVGDASPEHELAAAREAAASFRRRGKADPAALARHLDRKGFSRGAIYAVLREGGQEPPEEA